MGTSPDSDSRRSLGAVQVETMAERYWYSGGLHLALSSRCVIVVSSSSINFIRLEAAGKDWGSGLSGISESPRDEGVSESPLEEGGVGGH